MSIKVYEYNRCNTCRKALKFLDAKEVSFQKIPLLEKPPTKTELKKMLKALNGEIKKLFNTSGGEYKRLKLKDKLSSMSKDEAIDLLASNGGLVKRPFVIGKDIAMVGFKEEVWTEQF